MPCRTVGHRGKLAILCLPLPPSLNKVCGGSTAVLSLPAASPWLCTDEGEGKCLFLEGKVLLLLLHFRPSFSRAVTLTEPWLALNYVSSQHLFFPGPASSTFQYAHLQMFRCVDLSDVCGVGILYLVVNGILSLHHDADVPSVFFILNCFFICKVGFFYANTAGSCIFIQFDNLCFLLGVFRRIMLNVP